MTGAFATLPTPLGPFTALVDDDGAVLASGFTDDLDVLLELVHLALRPTGPVRYDDLGAVSAALLAYLDGDAGPAAAVPVVQSGGALVTEMWRQMRLVPAGTSVSYGELAAAAGRPTAPRWAARACAANAATLFVPCHRVRRSDGTLAGYRWGLELKEELLAAEAAAAAAPA